MPAFLVKLLLGQLVKNTEVKKRVFEALRAEAKKTDTKIDDEAIDAFEVIWDTALPAIIGNVG